MSATLNSAAQRDSLRLVERFHRPRTFPNGESLVALHETHISWVFVTERHAYKLKKPVRFDFLDFSTPELRHRACLEELRLNRRLAPGVYEAVLPVSRDAQGQFLVGTTESPVDWLVQMRRLPMDQTLDQYIRADKLTRNDVDRLAECLTDFYQQCSPLMIRVELYRAQLEAHVADNRQVLLDSRHGLSPELVQRVCESQIRFLRLWRTLLDERVCDGRIVDGHGDLKPEHICLTTPPVIFDCLEFNAELRQVDVADELAFLAMECELLGAEEVGQRVLDHYARVSGDRPARRLWAFYKAYRACVRAKVCALRASQETAAERRAEHLSAAQEYLWLADLRAKELGPPLVVLVGGFMGTGKSTLAAALAQQLGCEVLRTDQLRRELLGPSQQAAHYGADHYQTEQRTRIYDHLFRRAGERLSSGLSVLLDGSFLDSRWRAEAQSLARRRGAMFLAIRCNCPPDIARQRITERATRGDDASEARSELFDQQRATEDHPWQEPGVLNIDTTLDLSAQTNRIFDKLVDLAHKLPYP